MSKTEEELRAANRERQARWREKHGWLGEQRRLRNYGVSKAHREEGHNDTEVMAIEVEDPESGKRIRVWIDGRTRSGRVMKLMWEQLHGITHNAKGGIEVEGF